MTGVELPVAIEAVLVLLDKQQHSEETTQAIRGALELAQSWAVCHAENINLIYGDPALKHKTSRGWVAEEALAIGIYAALVGDDLADVIAIAANHNGDSDSTASIAGQIYGAWKGILSLPDYRDTITDVHVIMMKTLLPVNNAPVV
jgi:ADP-ribosylglycohydrolase